MNTTILTPKLIIENFFENVRSGKALDRVHEYMHETVIAHQIQSEHEYHVERTPLDYANHVLEMIETYGKFNLEISEMLADQNKVYVRWKQTSQAKQANKIIEIASAVYLLRDNKIAEYWIQVDRKGLELQTL